MTRDIDVIIAHKDKILLGELIEKIAQEQGLPVGKHAWLNDGVSFFGLQTRGEDRIFSHPNLVVYTASWYELLDMKLSGAWRRNIDFNDAIHILKAIGDNDRNETLKKSLEYKNISPFIDDATFIKRFDKTWKDTFGS